MCGHLTWFTCVNPVHTKTIQLMKNKEGSQSSIKDIIREHKLVFITLGLLLLYILFIQIIGFIISSIIFMIVTALIVGPRTKKDIITITSIAFVLTIGLYVFSKTYYKSDSQQDYSSKRRDMRCLIYYISVSEKF
nr:tripartite tricarboxylate transporter TctB family protein [Piscibacillus salipiscarius]